jgi:hypothetical protein
MAKIHAVETVETPETPLLEDGVTIEEPKEDPRYFVLKKPLVVVGANVKERKEIDRLLVDASELSGRQYFSLIEKFRTKHPETFRTSPNRLTEEVFLAMIVCELNGIAEADLYKLTFKEIPLLFYKTQGFMFS